MRNSRAAGKVGYPTKPNSHSVCKLTLDYRSRPTATKGKILEIREWESKSSHCREVDRSPHCSALFELQMNNLPDFLCQWVKENRQVQME
ncbi:hypothetical protein AVEN_216124-1 [Araneus ventricosus]|uniref:Uncharacterized protein n=1 Tax=Araneus ventricosus TaxID=182803 RepID=A0A4Y2UHW1_ARAVE|nr:hypothetical protein AVEN_216124-1 [Araneus ventricosus]